MQPGYMATQNPFEMSSKLMEENANFYSGNLSNINEYINPYYDQVIDAALGRMGTNYQKTMGAIGDSAIAAGAFGGARHGVAEGVATGEYNKNVGDMTSDLYARGFESAADKMYRMAQGRTQLGGMYYDVGKDIVNTQSMQGNQQQELMNKILAGGNGMFDDMMQHPYNIINMMQAILSSDARRGAGTVNSSSTPGLYDYLGLAAQAAGAMYG